MKRSLLWITVCALLCMLLSGCSAIGLDVETQLIPPQSSGEQEGIRAALDEYISTHTQVGESEEYTLKYPSGGQYLSAFIMLDQVKEHTVLTAEPSAAPTESSEPRQVLAFYRRNNENALLHINLLQCDTSGVWSSVADVEGKGESVNQVEFADLNNDGKPELLIGWSLYNTQDSRLSIYNIDENLVARNFSSTYTDLVVADVTADGGDDLLLLSISHGFESVTAQLFSFKSNNEIVSGMVMLDSSIVEFGSHITAPVYEDGNGVFLDCYKEQDAMITELIAWTDGQLKAPLCDQATMLNSETAREKPITCRDIDGDGMVEWPVTTRMPGFEEALPQNTLWYTEWCHYNAAEDAAEMEFAALIPAEDGYMLRLREEWNALPAAYSAATRTLTVYRNTDSGEWLFRIVTLPIEDKANLPNGYVLLDENDDACYAVRIADDVTTVSMEEIQYLFNLLEESV